MLLTVVCTIVGLGAAEADDTPTEVMPASVRAATSTAETVNFVFGMSGVNREKPSLSKPLREEFRQRRNRPANAAKGQPKAQKRTVSMTATSTAPGHRQPENFDIPY
jgi:hypothetical protein